MEIRKCQCCGDKFDRSKAASEVDSKYTFGTYEYYFQSNDFCTDCALDLIREDEESED